MSKIRPLIKYPGGKSYLAKQIVDLMPDHKIYVEPYGGSASVLIAKPPAEVECYNDISMEIWNLFQVLRDRPEEFRQALTLTPYHEQEYDLSLSKPENLDVIELARRTYVGHRMSFGGVAGGGFSMTKRRSRAGMADVVSGFLSSIDANLPLIIERLRRVQFLYREALTVISEFDSPDTLFYLDPPYPHETRVSTNLYDHEMSLDEHRQLCYTVRNLKGKVILSSYHNTLYDEEFKEWTLVEIETDTKASGEKTKSRRVECLWVSPTATR